MLRHDRSRFLAFGILPLLNVVSLLLHGLGLATHGRGGAAASLPLLVVLAIVVLLAVPWAAVKRGRDLGWSAALSLTACMGSLLFGPAVLVLAGYLGLAKGQDRSNAFGPPPPPATLSTWSGAIVLIVLPWAILAVAARVLE